MKKILFLGITEYNLSQDDLSLGVKFGGLNKFFRIYVMARGAKWQAEKYGVSFYLTSSKFSLFLWPIIVFFRSWRLIKKENIDVIISQSPSFEGVIAGLLKIVTRRQLIVEIHGDWIESPFFYHRLHFKRLIRWLLINAGRFSLYMADKVRVISDFTRELAEGHGGGVKIRYQFPTFTDIDKFLDESRIDWDPTVLYVGVLYRLKGVHFLIQAMGKIQTKYPEVRLVIVGDGPYRQILEDLAGNLKPRSVQFLGRLPVAQVKEQMRKCTVVVLPSLSEGLGRVLVEAAALGKPIIGSQTGGIPEVIRDGENGFLFPPGDVGMLAEKLNLLLSNLEQAKQIGAHGREIVEKKFSTKCYFAAFKEMIES